MPNPTFTLGWELEACRSAVTVPPHVIAERDGSVSGDGREYKIDATAALIPSESLRALRALVSDSSLHVNRTCGFHVHVGLAGRISPSKRKQWASAFVLLARAVEPYAFNAVPPSRRVNQYCRAWRSDNGSVIARRYSSHKYSNDSRYMWVNVVEAFRPSGIGTVEVRLLGSTKRYPYLFAWAALCHRMAAASWRLMSDPSGLPNEVEGLKADFQNVASQILTMRRAADAARTSAVLGMQAGFISSEELEACTSDLQTMCAVRPDPSETAETRLTEMQAMQEAYREAVMETRRPYPVLEPMTPRRARRPHLAPFEVPPTLPTDLPAGFNPDAFAVIPTTNGGNQ